MKRNYYYVTLSRYDAARIDDVQHNRPHFYYLKDARRYARIRGYMIFKVRTAADTGDIIGYTQIK